ncbi:ArsR family transcriptional regulator [Flavobacterium sp.]|uniref:ArsR family transcriptional regulator n=1 Tax=Flavobacterium sp. TaxID=239 RepID=UPI0024891516|nr:ArsR family transcriptional regulator [Flavobacterium sp.]MDI1318559.1 ArsR family transcriptional regulator [Flavobacterium sp.]
MLENLITSKTRLRLLVKFFINVANEGYLRGLASEMHESTNAIRKELNNLTEAGYLIRQETNQKITYKANQHNPFFILLQQIVRKYIGLDTIIEMVLERMGSVHRVFIIGDYAKGIDSGRIEVVLEGDDLNEEYIKKLSQKIENEIQKEVVFYLTNQHDNSGLLVFEQELTAKNLDTV